METSLHKFPDSRYFSHDFARWALNGAQVPPPTILKELQLGSYLLASGYKRFVETGTLEGWTSHAMNKLGSRVDTIELSEFYYNRAKDIFSGNEEIICHFGDSKDVLPKILETLEEPALFWLDGHYSGGETALAEYGSTPIAYELEALATHKIKNHIVIVDDIRGFGYAGYPTVEWCTEIGSKIVDNCTPILSHDALIFASNDMHEKAKSFREQTIQTLLD